MDNVWRSRVTRYLAALVIVAAALLIKLLLAPSLDRATPFLLFFGAVALSSWFGGYGPALVSLAAAAACALYFFMPPYFSLELQTEQLIVIALFLLEGVVLVALLTAARNAIREPKIASPAAPSEVEPAKDDSAALLDLIQLTAPIGMCFWDRDLRYVRINYTMAALSDLSPGAHIGKTVEEVMPNLGGDVVTTLKSVLETGIPVLNQEVTQVRRGMLGEKQEHWLVSYYRVRGADGISLGVGAIMVDITERKLYEDRTRALLTLTSAFAKAIELSEVGTIIESSVSEIGAAGAIVRILDKERVRLRNISHFGVPEEFNKRLAELPLTVSSPSSDVIKTGEPVWLEAFKTYEERYPEIAASVLSAVGTRSHVTLPLTVDEEVLGTLALGFKEERTFDNEERQFLLAVAQQCAQAIRRMLLYEAEREAHEQTAEAQKRISFLADASEVLASSLDYETTLAVVARLAVPTIADWCAVDVMQEDETLKRLAVTHVDPAKVDYAYELQRRFPPNPDAAQGVYHVMRTGEPELYEDIPDNLLVTLIQDPEVLQIIRDLGLSSSLIVPLRVRDKTLGTLSLIMAESGRHYSHEDLPYVLDLARRAALAIDNAQLYKQATRDAS